MKRPELVNIVSIKKITVLLADDHASFRKSLKVSIESHADIEVVGEAKNGREAVRFADSLHPDVIIMDIGMPLLNGLQATQQIIERGSATRVLILSAHPEPEYIKQAVMLGASGYLVKQSSTQVLVQAVREIAKGNTYFSTSIPRRLREECRKLFEKVKLLRNRMQSPVKRDLPRRSSRTAWATNSLDTCLST